MRVPVVVVVTKIDLVGDESIHNNNNNEGSYSNTSSSNNSSSRASDAAAAATTTATTSATTPDIPALFEPLTTHTKVQRFLQKLKEDYTDTHTTFRADDSLQVSSPVTTATVATAASATAATTAPPLLPPEQLINDHRLTDASQQTNATATATATATANSTATHASTVASLVAGKIVPGKIAPVIAVSSVTGRGLSLLRSLLRGWFVR